MTTMTHATTTAPVARHQTLRVTQPRVLLSEWTKFRSLRSTVWTLLTAVVLSIGIGALFSAVSASQYHTFSAADRASFNPVSTSLDGMLFAQLAIGVLGVLLISHHLGVSISAPNALRDVIGAALYATVAGMIGMALGGLLRNTAAGISTFVAVFFVIPPLTNLLPSSWTSHFVQYLPSNAGEVLFGGGQGLAHPLAPWTGFGLLCAYAAVMIGLAAWRLRRADA
jgi:hypothetical protein